MAVLALPIQRTKDNDMPYFYISWTFQGKTHVFGSRKNYEIDKAAGRVA